MEKQCPVCEKVVTNPRRVYCCTRCRQKAIDTRRGKNVLPFIRPIATIDGESYRTADGHSVYYLLQALEPDGTIRTLEHEDGRRLQTLEILDFLFRGSTKVYYGYALEYDINNWLWQIAPIQLDLLRDYGCFWYRGYRVEWYPSRMTKIMRRGPDKKCTTISIYDLYPFCQTSFVKALQSWGLEVPDIVVEMKKLRSEFTLEDRDRIRVYNEAELGPMQQLYHKIMEAAKAQHMLPSRPLTGPGGLAIELLRRHDALDCTPKEQREKFCEAFRILTRVDRDAPVESAEQACWRAYYGGRTELSYIGETTAVEYDITSAYPAAIVRGLPCFCAGEWRRTTSLDHPWSVYQVRWRRKDETSPEVWGPLPYRNGRGLAYTTDGVGWYHQEELLTAIEELPQYDYEIVDGYAWCQSCDHQPLSWLAELADYRVKIKKEKPGESQILKLAMNSVYGKYADHVGINPVPLPDPPPVHAVRGCDKPRLPQAHNIYYAGLITARTRCKLLQGLGQASREGARVYMMSTDSLHVSQPINLDASGRLGAWELSIPEPTPVIFIACGFYFYEGSKNKTRGVSLAGIDDPFLYARNRLSEEALELPDQRLVSIRNAWSRANRDYNKYLDLVCRWDTSCRGVRLHSLEPRRVLLERGSDYSYWAAPTARRYDSLRAMDHLLGMDEVFTAELVHMEA